LDGVLIIDKPVGPTSHDVVARVRRALRERRVGHTGTLDPAASGVLPLVVGRATRLARFLSASNKRYEAVVRLGFATDTGDAQGAPVGRTHDGSMPRRDEIDAALETCRGTFLQQPPVYSAKKIAGHRSYRLARAAARSVQRHAANAQNPEARTQHAAPAPVTVHVGALSIISVDADRVTLDVSCSAGFYVRALARDLGDRLGTGGHLAELRRTRSGDYGLADAIALDIVERDRESAATAFIPLARLLPQLSWVVLTPQGVTHAHHGRELAPPDLMSRGGSSQTIDGSVSVDEGSVSSGVEGSVLSGVDGWIRLLDSAGRLVGLARARGASGLLHPAVVLM
jgi:tRNA pseudouridine55 synthase